MTMQSLINIDGNGLKDVLIDLNDKLATAVGWIANKETPEKIAINTYIKEIQEKNYDPVTKAALISNAKKIIKGYYNQSNIVEIARSSLQNNADPQKLEDDWLARFMDKAQLVSSEEFQWIWGKNLARECNEPGSIPPALLYTLEKMDREDAEAFTALCRISVSVEKDASPIVIRERFAEYEELVGITFDKIVSLTALGLIETDLAAVSAGYKMEIDPLPNKIIYYDMEKELKDKRDLQVGNVLFTKAGQALYWAIDAEKVEGFWENYCIPFWEK